MKQAKAPMLTEPVCSLKKIQALLESNQNIAALADATAVLEAMAESKPIIRLVLIDPPYNRRTQFHHYDDSTSTVKWSKEREEHAERLRDLLTEDGSLWMHIDDAEMGTARIILDRLFGKRNFLGTIVWQKTVSRDNRMAVSTTHEYILAYAKNKTVWSKARNKIAPQEAQLNRYSNRDNDPRGPWASGDLTAKAGPGRRAEQFYDLVTPSGRTVKPSSGTAWRFTWIRMQEMINDNRIFFGDGNRMPRLKRFLSEVGSGLVPSTWWPGEEVGTADSAKRHLKLMIPNVVPFETPKPELLAARILGIASNPGELVVDIYGGSGTTAAVAHKMGRRWLTCERERQTFEEFLRPRLNLVVSGSDQGGISLENAWSGGGSYVVVEDPSIPNAIVRDERKPPVNHT